MSFNEDGVQVIDGGNTNIQIRIRKGSDAPSLGEVREKAPAPLASFDAISDMEDSDDGGGKHSDTEEVFGGEEHATTLGVPGKANTTNKTDEERDQEVPKDQEPMDVSGENGTANEDPNKADPNTAEGFMDYDWTPNVPQVEEELVLEKITVSDDDEEEKTVEENKDQVVPDSEGYTQMEDTEMTEGPDEDFPPPPPPETEPEGDPGYSATEEPPNPGYYEAPSTFTEDPNQGYTEAQPGEAPNPGYYEAPSTFTEDPNQGYTEAQPEEAPNPGYYEAPSTFGDQDESYYQQKYGATSGTTATPGDSSWGGGANQEAEEPGEGDENEEEEVNKMKITLPKGAFASKKKPPRPSPSRPPPPSVKKGPPRPPVPSASPASKPSRPPPPGGAGPPRPGQPPQKPESGKSWETFEGKGKKDDNDFTMYFKHEKKKRLVPKKLKTLITTPEKAAKKEAKKAEKERRRQAALAQLSRFVPHDDTERGEDWEAYHDLLNKSKETVAKTKEKLAAEAAAEAEAEAEEEEASSPEVDPWGETGQAPQRPKAPPHPSQPPSRPQPPNTGANPVVNVQQSPASWEGFDDDFSVTPNIAQGKNLPHLTVSPLPSPRHNPVPPNNSTRTSLEDLTKTETGTGSAKQKTNGNVEQVIQTSVAPRSRPKGAAPVNDALGLGINDTAKTLSRNPIEDNKSSGQNSPAEEMFNTKDTGNGAMTLVDDFLGLDGDTEVVKPVQNPLEMLMAKDKLVSDSVVPKDDDDDIFGLKCGPKIEAATVNSEGDLFDFGEKPEREDEDELFDTSKYTDPEAFAAELAKASEEVEKEATDLQSPASDDFDPRSDIPDSVLKVKPAEDKPPPKSKSQAWVKPRSRPRPRPKKVENPFTSENTTGIALPKPTIPNPFADIGDDEATETSAINPFTDVAGEGEGVKSDATDGEGKGEAAAGFNPFATIHQEEEEEGHEPKVATSGDAFDPFATIHDDDAFDEGVAAGSTDDNLSEDEEGAERVNPFNKDATDPMFVADFSGLNSQLPTEKSEDTLGSGTPRGTLSQDSSTDDEELEPLEPFHPPFSGDGWHLYLRQPPKKKLGQNRFWKPVYARLIENNNVPIIRLFNDDKTTQHFHELQLQPSYNFQDEGLQQYDQYGKCHVLKIQYVFYSERVGVKAERIAPTLGDLVRVRDMKGLKDLVHKPKATMLLSHSPQTSELMKFGGLDYDQFRHFMWTLENAFFKFKVNRDIKAHEYSKDEITVDIVDEYRLEIDVDGHIIFHTARVRLFCLSFLSGAPHVEVGLNEKRRRGKEIVGRHDIIPIKTEEWIKIEDPEFHHIVDLDEYNKTTIIKFRPLDACQFEIMRFRTRPRRNKELPLQIRVQQTMIKKRFELRADVLIPGYASNSRRAQQTPCEDIQIRFPIPEPWIYMFRVEKRFKYGSKHATVRKAGKIKGLERLTMLTQGFLPPSLIEVSTGDAKYEHLFRAVVWRIPRLPERNQGAYKTHLFALKLDLGPHDVMPEDFAKTVTVEYTMPNSTVSRAQIRSIGVQSGEDPPDRWVHHTAKYEYTVEIEFPDKVRAPNQLPNAPEMMSTAPIAKEEDTKKEEEDMPGKALSDTDSSDSDSD